MYYNWDYLFDSYLAKSKEELFDTKVELELVKEGVREEKLEPAKDYISYKLEGNVEDLDKRIKEILKEFPEWVKSERPAISKIGMSVGEEGDGLTAEERRLKEMGINPKD